MSTRERPADEAGERGVDPGAEGRTRGEYDPDERWSVSRREALRTLGLLPVAGALGWTPGGLARAARFVASPPEALAPDGAPGSAGRKFFTAHEWATVRLLADYVIPRDERSGSATDAKAPEFVDFMLVDAETTPASQLAMRGGLAWLDRECHRRVGATFIDAGDGARRQLLDDIAFPAKARPEYSAGMAFFSLFRNVIAAAFFSSAMGWADLQYTGNVFNPNWTGCPEPALRKLDVSYEAYEASLVARRQRPA